MRKQYLCGVAAATMMWAVSAQAQSQAQASDAQPAATAAVPEQDQEGLQDIVVTAQRRSESLQRAAIAATAVTGDTLVNAGISDPAQLTKLIPALTVQPVGISSSFFIDGDQLGPGKRHRVFGRWRVLRAPDRACRHFLRSRPDRGAEGSARYALWPQRDRRRDQPHSQAARTRPLWRRLQCRIWQLQRLQDAGWHQYPAWRHACAPRRGAARRPQGLSVRRL